jgi:hypothetical protein
VSKFGTIGIKSGMKNFENGEAVLIGDDEKRGKDPVGLRIHRRIWEAAEKSARRVEAKYGLEELGPWTDFEWGVINGKLSALRWVPRQTEPRGKKKVTETVGFSRQRSRAGFAM